ncbi:MAG: dipeptide epimerase [Leptolyngbyaceae bacterium]|nr:dipeptide epimerase [Leptolyngbyaceae bacterium]
MHLQVQPFTVHKRFALTISRGTTAHSTNLWVRLEHDGIEGWGEASPFSVGAPQTTEILRDSLEAIAPQLQSLTPFDQGPVHRIMAQFQMPSAARNAIDVAIHDWIGKKLGVPLWKLWGGEGDRIVPTSVTIGISTPEAAQQRLQHWLEQLGPHNVRAVKIKLGNPAGIDADKAMVLALQADIPTGAKVSIDANGGWSVADALQMGPWLADQGVTYIEQPLPHGQEQDLPQIYRASPLPIIVDESCFTSRDIPTLAAHVHGINIKLMKCGGLSEALRMVHTAQAHGLQIMFGCYSDSTLANTAAAQLAPFAHHLDLDSHLNLTDDPFTGITLEKGCLRLSDQPGLGVWTVHSRNFNHP